MNKCKVCGKPIPETLTYCSKECQEKDLETPITNNKAVKGEIETALLDPHYMRGLLWRKDKLEAIHRAFQAGYDEDTVLRILMRGGLTRLTARKLIADSRKVFGE